MLESDPWYAQRVRSILGPLQAKIRVNARKCRAVDNRRKARK